MESIEALVEAVANSKECCSRRGVTMGIKFSAVARMPRKSKVHGQPDFRFCHEEF